MPEKISEEVSVGVLAELVENKPVTKIAMSQNTATGGKVGVSETSDAEEEKDISEFKNLRIKEEKLRKNFFKFQFNIGYISKNLMLPERRHKNDQHSKNEVKSSKDGQTK